MADAPIGSCFNDPTQAKCPPSRAMNGELQQPTDSNDRTSYAPLDGDSSSASKAATTARKAPKAQAAQQYNQCFLYASYPNDGGTYVYGEGEDICTSAVTRHELYVNLDKYYNGKWYQMDTGSAAGGPGTTIRAYVGYGCHGLPTARMAGSGARVRAVTGSVVGKIRRKLRKPVLRIVA